MSGYSQSYSKSKLNHTRNIAFDDMFKSQSQQQQSQYKSQSQHNSQHNIDSKKNKGIMVRRNNDRIAQRTDDEIAINQGRRNNQTNVDRIMLERSMTSHSFDNESQSSESDDNYVGEITGETINESDIFDKGMPLRSNFTIKQSKYDDNPYNDFDLHRKEHKKKKTLNTVGYLDSSSDYAGLDEAMKSITKGSDPYEICISDLNSTTCWMHSNMFKISQDSFVMNGFGLFSGFGILYLISRGNTELELKNYFNFQDKKHLNAGLLTIRDSLNQFRDQIVMDSYIINDKNIPNNTQTAKKLKSLIFSVMINRDYPDQEAQRVNHIINTVSRMKNVISASTLSKSDISLISVCLIDPIWAYKIDNIIKGRFRGSEEIKTNSIMTMDFIRFMGKTFDYYEDAEKQVIEIPMFGEVYCIGMILTKTDNIINTDLKTLGISINYLRPTVLDEVMIPMINKRYKTRLNGTLQKTGLNIVFSEQEMAGLYPEGGSLNDVIQYIDIMFGTRCGKKKCENKGYRTTRKFIANRSFEFYLRNCETNCILAMGRI